MTEELKNSKILVTPTSYAKNDPTLRTKLEAEVGEVVYNPTGRPLSSDELLELIPGCDGYIAGLDAIDRAVINGSDKLRVIARYGVGVDNVDLDAARERGIVVTNTPGANSASVAELTVGLILSLGRKIPEAVQAAKKGEWPRMTGISLEGKTIGLLGFGAIAKNVARRLAGFDCDVIAYHPSYDIATAESLGVQLRPEEDLIREADFLSLHLPLNPESRGMVNSEFLGKMKPGAFLINTSRGELIDEEALFEALQSGRLQGAALDAFSKQPPDPGNPLLAMPQVIATPHMGAHTDGATNAMGWAALQDCLAVLRGEQPIYRVT
jgi:D-3-phosphoglycerate dehydrogenase